MHNTSTVFPESFDNRFFFNDVRLRHADIMRGYRDYLLNKDYVGASQYLYNNVEIANQDMDYNGAYLWNTLENRVSAIENYAISMEETNVRPYCSNVPPTQKMEHMSWICD
jgi:hypothetical protein